MTVFFCRTWTVLSDAAAGEQQQQQRQQPAVDQFAVGAERRRQRGRADHHHHQRHRSGVDVAVPIPTRPTQSVEIHLISHRTTVVEFVLHHSASLALPTAQFSSPAWVEVSDELSVVFIPPPKKKGKNGQKNKIRKQMSDHWAPSACEMSRFNGWPVTVRSDKESAEGARRWLRSLFTTFTVLHHAPPGGKWIFLLRRKLNIEHIRSSRPTVDL